MISAVMTIKYRGFKSVKGRHFQFALFQALMNANHWV